MNLLEWQILETIATWISAVAIVAGAVFVVFEMRDAAKDRYLQISNSMFEIWHSPEFQEDQLLLLHQLPASTWSQFTANGRGSRLERAFHRVGSFYDRVGNLVMSGLVRQDQLLPTISGDAIRVWQKIEPLVREARKAENLLLFQNYEAVLPNCLECYVPIAMPAEVKPAIGAETLALDPEVKRIEPAELKQLMDADQVAVLDVTKHEGFPQIAGALRAVPNELSGWLNVLPKGKDVVTYCT